jgi:hypothetical protein
MKQEQALQILKSGKNVFLTGSAGTGKTYILNAYIRWLREHNVKVAVTASTGIAATHVSGSTIHSWSGIGIKDEISQSYLQSLRTKKYLKDAIQKTHVLIIDEISMLHRNQLDAVNRVLRYLRSDPSPFGGMQVVFCGDFFQLPPVSKNNESSAERYAFMCDSWVQAGPVVCYLTEQYRQEYADSLNTVLNKIRFNEVDQDVVDILQEAMQQDLSIEPTRLYTHNADVDAINEQELAKIDSEPQSFFAEKKGNIKMMETFMKSLIVPEKLVLKKGAKVMFLKNNKEKDYYNGTIGTVIDFVKDEDNNYLPKVQLSDKRKIVVAPEIWAVENEKGSTLVSVTQIPLRLAWAITVHKCQGMTLEAAEIDLSKSFEYGQGYVGLSRLKDLKGLKLLGFNRMSLEMDPLATKADNRFRELSKQAEDIPTEELEKMRSQHILSKGGRLTKTAIKGKKPKVEKVPTIIKTLDLIEQGKSIKEIAKIRELAIITIEGHVAQLVEKYPEKDFSKFSPPKDTLEEIKKGLQICLKKASEEDITKDGNLNSKVLFDHFNAKYSYTTLKMAQAFINLEKQKAN